MKITINDKEYELEDLKIIGNIPEEQEITVTATADEDYMSVYTSDNTYLTKLKKLVAANPKEWKITDVYFMRGKLCGVRLIAPKKFLSFRTASVEREMTEEQKQAAAERMRTLRTKQLEK